MKTATAEKLDDYDFQPNWKNLGLRLVDASIDKPKIQDNEPLIAILNEVRGKVANSDVEVEDSSEIIEPINKILAEIDQNQKNTEDPNEQKYLRVLHSIMIDLRKKLDLLIDFFKTQKRHYDKTIMQKLPFGLISKPKYLAGTKDPEDTKRIIKRIMSHTEASYKELGVALRFPLISKSDDPNIVRQKLTADLWRAYNEINELPIANRNHYRGSILPNFSDCRFNVKRFASTFGSFSAACKETIHSAPVAEGEALVDKDTRKLQEFIKARDLSKPPKYLDSIHPSIILDKIKEIEARGVTFQSTYWWWINASNTQRDMQIESAWRRSTKLRRHSELTDVYGIDPDEYLRFIRKRDSDQIREFCKIIEAAGLPVEKNYKKANRYTFINLRSLLARKLKSASTRKSKPITLTKAQETWLRKQDLVAALKTDGVKELGAAKKIPIEDILDEASDEDLDMLEKEDKNKAVLEQLKNRYLLRKRLEEKLRRHRLGYREMDYFTESEDRILDTLAKIELLESIDEKVTEAALLQDEPEIMACKLDDEQKEVEDYLLEVGCYPHIARKLALSGERLISFEVKVDFFESIKLDPKEYGKNAFEIDDFEVYLKYPFAYCTNQGLKQIRRNVINQAAKQRLKDELGIQWVYHGFEWQLKRTIPATMLHKHKLAAKLPTPALTLKLRLISQYSEGAISELKKFIQYISSQPEASAKPDETFLQFAIVIFNHIARTISKNLVVSEKTAKTIKEKLIAIPLSPIISTIQESGLAPEALSTQYAIYIFQSGEAPIRLVDKPEDPTAKEEPTTKTARLDRADLSALDYIMEGVRRDYKTLTREEEVALAKQKATGDKEAAQALVNSCLRLVVKIAKKYRWSTIPFEDLIQMGYQKLAELVKRFDHKRNARLTTFVYPQLNGYLFNIAKSSSKGTIKINPKLAAQEFKYNRAIEEFKAKHNGREANSDEELAEFMEISLEKLMKLKKAAGTIKHLQTQSLDESTNPKDSTSRPQQDMIGIENTGLAKAETMISREQMLAELKRVFMEEFIPKKKKRAWDIFLNLFGFTENEETMSRKELAKKHNCTIERIRQIKEEILDFIRSKPKLMHMIEASASST